MDSASGRDHFGENYARTGMAALGSDQDSKHCLQFHESVLFAFRRGGTSKQMLKTMIQEKDSDVHK